MGIMNGTTDYDTGFDLNNYEVVTIELPRDIIESVENFTQFAPENDISAAYAWLLRRGIKYEKNEGKVF